MKPTTTIVFSLLLILTLALYVYLEKPSGSIFGSNGPKASERLLVMTQDDEVTKIQIQNQKTKETIELEKAKDNWNIIKPITDRADAFMADGLETALLVSTKARRLKREKESWQEFGLENPAIKISIQTKQNPNWRTLALGDESQVDSLVFARWE